jgi:hypothetical protein
MPLLILVVVDPPRITARAYHAHVDILQTLQARLSARFVTLVRSRQVQEARLAILACQESTPPRTHPDPAMIAMLGRMHSKKASANV